MILAVVSLQIEIGRLTNIGNHHFYKEMPYTNNLQPVSLTLSHLGDLIHSQPGGGGGGGGPDAKNQA